MFWCLWKGETRTWCAVVFLTGDDGQFSRAMFISGNSFCLLHQHHAEALHKEETWHQTQEHIVKPVCPRHLTYLSLILSLISVFNFPSPARGGKVQTRRDASQCWEGKQSDSQLVEKPRCLGGIYFVCGVRCEIITTWCWNLLGSRLLTGTTLP